MSVYLSHARVDSIVLKTKEGHAYDLINLRPTDLPIEILAHNLAILNRFGGNSKHPWSIASHSVLVSLMLPPELQYDGLMHDTTEGTGLVDICSPVKKEMPDYRKLEDHVRRSLAKFYVFSEKEPPGVKVADFRAFQLESFFLRGETPPAPITPWELAIARPLLEHEISWRMSRDMFLEHYRHLMGLRGFH